MRSPYEIIKRLYLTERTKNIATLHQNPRIAARHRGSAPKAVFVVANDANKVEIAAAVEKIYADQGVRVTAVNTLNAKSKERRVRGRRGVSLKGVKSGFKKAIVTFRPGDVLDGITG